MRDVIDNTLVGLAITAFFVGQGVLYVFVEGWLTLAWVVAIIVAMPVLAWREFR